MAERDRPAQTGKERSRALARLKEAVSSRSRSGDEPKPAKRKPRKASVSAARRNGDKRAR